MASAWGLSWGRSWGDSWGKIRSPGGDDAPESERQRIARLREEQAYVDRIAQQAKDDAQIKRMEADLLARAELAAIEAQLKAAMLANDEAMILLLDDELRRKAVKLWLML